MRICLRLLGGDSWLGGVYYTQNLIRCLAALPPEERAALHITLQVPRGSEKHAEPVAGLVDYVVVLGPLGRNFGAAGRWIAGRFRSPWSRRFRRYDFVYPASAQARGLSPGAGWIPDFQHRHLPELFSEAERVARDRSHLNIARGADRVVLSSRMAADDFLRFYPESAHKAKVLRFTSVIEDEWLKTRSGPVIAARGLPTRFFLVSNQFWIHKNHRLVVEAAGECAGRGNPVHVVFTGGFHDPRAQDYVGGLRRRIAELGLTAHMHIVGQIPRAEQIQLFRECLAVIQPSKFEGWSTVIEDARALGKQVFMSKFPVHLEQAPPAGRYFADDDPSALAALLLERAQDPRSGYDAETETRAIAESHGARARVGREFLAIARECSS